jgi:histidyl-tRNA synthetase
LTLEMPDYVPPRGMKDIDTGEMEKRLWINEKIEPVFDTHNFRRVEPSFIEHLETLTAKSGSSVMNEIYHFKDKSGRDLALRFDLTVGIARMVANDFATPEPIKLYAISPMWRYDEPQAGRFRCFWQWDIEEFGPSEVYADAEVIGTSVKAMQALGLSDVSVRMSSRKLMEELIASISPTLKSDTVSILRILDKSAKVGEEELKSMLRAGGMDAETVERLLEATKLSGNIDAVRDGLNRFRSEKLNAAMKELVTVWEELESIGVRHACTVDLGIVRGLDYYDGIVFEGFEAEAGNLSLFGGGRYNGLTRIYGKRDLPATGAAGGIERLLMVLEKRGTFKTGGKTARVFVAITTDAVRRNGLAVCQRLRSRGIVAEYPVKRWSLRRQLEYANTAGFTHVLVVGEREVQRSVYTLKELKSGTQYELDLEGVLSSLAPVAQHG